MASPTSEPNTDPNGQPASWVGRASVAPPPVVPVDPYEQVYEPVYAPAPVFYPPPKRRPRVLATLGFIAAMCILGSVVTLLVYAVLRPNAGPRLAGPTPTTATTPPAVPTTPPPAGVGTPVRDGQFEFVITKVECGRSKVNVGPVKRDANGQYCLVSLSVRNVGDSRRTFSEAFQTAIGTDGNDYDADIAAGLMVNEGSNGLVNSLSPGETARGTMVFDVPHKVELAALELHDSLLSGGVTVTL